MSAIVHLAGPAIRAASVIRQRCAWCGALIEERDLDRMSIALRDGESESDAWRDFIDDDGNPARGWSGLVAIDVCDGVVTAKWSVDDPTDGKIPEDSCMALDTGVTA